MAKGSEASKGAAVICADAGTVRVMLGDQPAAGLFVIYRVAPPKADQAQSWIQTVAPKIPPASFTLCFVDGQGFLQKVVSDNNPWHDIAPQLAELEAAAISGAKKGAQPKGKKGVKALPRSCESEKLHADVEYEIALVAHPSLKVAKAAMEYLQNSKASGPYPFPKDKSELLLRGKLTLVEDKGNQQLSLSVESLAPGKKLARLFWPAGSARYGDWVLYRLMPYDHLEEVKQQVSKLCEDLAALRYPASLNPHEPFPGAGGGEPGFALHTAAIVHRFEQSVAEGKAFQLADKGGAASGALGKAALPQGWRAISPRPSWDWLCGKPVAELKKPYAFTADQVHPGVVDARVGDAIAGFLKDKLRHPGAVLIEVNASMKDGHLWGRPELVFSIEMLRVLLTRFGVPYGAMLTHTYRPIAAPGGTGKAECSNHKLGLAVDLAIASAAGGKAQIQDHGHPARDFPVRYQAVYGDPALPPIEKLQKQLDDATNGRVQAETDLAKANEALAAGLAEPAGARGAEATAQRKKLADLQKQQKAADGALKKAENREEAAAGALQQKHAIGETKADQNLSWVLCAHSYWDIFAAGKKSDDLADELSKCLGKPAKPEDAWDAEKEYRNLLLSGFPGAPTGFAAELVDKFVGRMRALCVSLAAMDPLEFRHQLFRQTVRQFQYNPFERDGGDEGPEIAANSDDAWRTAYVNATLRVSAFHKWAADQQKVHSFVNFSRLANECDLWGISAVRGNAQTKGSFRNPMSDPDLPVKPPARVSYEVNKDSFPALASLLADLKSAGAEAVDDQIDLKLPDGKELSMKVNELDIDFVIAWAEEMGKVQVDRIGKPKKEEGTGKKDPPPPPAISWEGIDAVILAYPTTKPEIDTFCQTFSNKPLRIITVGAQLKIEAAAGTSGSFGDLGGALANYLKNVPTEQANAGKPNQSTKKTNTDYAVTIRPIFRKKDELTISLGSTLTLPARGVPAPLEWWHHEQGLRGAETYGKNAEDLGFSQIFLSADKGPPVADVAPEVGGFGYPTKKMGIVRKLRKTNTGGAPQNDAEEGESDG